MPDASTYPAHLVPQPFYRRLESQQVVSGRVLRRASQPDVTDMAGKILPDQLSHPTEDLARHFSVNLLGDFQVRDTAWVISRGEAKARLTSAWQPGETGIRPAADEAECTPATHWGYYWLLLQEVHGCEFESIGEKFTCHIHHAPTRCNYWHFELHFHNQTGDVFLLEPKLRKKVAPKLRAWLQDYVHTTHLEPPPAAVKWPEVIYRTAVAT